MWDSTAYHFKCPYCGCEYERCVGCGDTYEYKDEYYDLYECPNCKEEFLGKYHKDIYIKMPDDKKELKDAGYWIS